MDTRALCFCHHLAVLYADMADIRVYSSCVAYCYVGAQLYLGYRQTQYVHHIRHRVGPHHLRVSDFLSVQLVAVVHHRRARTDYHYPQLFYQKEPRKVSVQANSTAGRVGFFV